ncbi:MAG: cell division protein ZapA [Gemmatimonadetes bacterium]|nr:cell division protein ZapA [Gemmatimonadota bacterium]
MSPRKSSRHSVTVEIGGERHVFRSDAPPEYTRACADHVDTTLRSLSGYQGLEAHRAAILAALSITDELFRAREEIRRLRDEGEQRAAAAAEVLERAVETASAAPAEGEEPPGG